VSAALLGLVGALLTAPRGAWGRSWTSARSWSWWSRSSWLRQLRARAVGTGDWVSSAAHLAGLAVGSMYGYLVRSGFRMPLPPAADAAAAHGSTEPQSKGPVELRA
jgi:hypothetical protein